MNEHIEYANRKSQEFGITLMIASVILGLILFGGLVNFLIWVSVR